jgi:hypothetical protein
MVQRADAYHAAAYHHDAGMSFQVLDLPRANANASRSVTRATPNKTPIATIPYGNATGRSGTGYLEVGRNGGDMSKRRQNLSETDETDATVA